MNPAALFLIALAQAPSAAPAPEPPPKDSLTLEGPAVVFVAPAGAAGDALRLQMERLRETFKKRKVRAVVTAPTLVRLGEEDNPRKRVRKVDFRNTPDWAGTVIFTESADPRIHQGQDEDEQLLDRIGTYLLMAGKAGAR